MSKTIGNDLKTHLAGESTTLATCWRIERTDAQEFFFTDHDTDIVYDGDTYESASGMLPTELSQNLALAVDNLDVLAFLEAAKIAEADIEAGLFDFASLDIFAINYADTSQGVMYYLKDWKLGEVKIEDHAVRVEARGKAQLLAQQLTDLYTPGCRARLGDSDCGIDVEDSAGTYWRTGTVTSASDYRTFIDTGRTETSDVFRFGKLTWTSGNNNGYEMEIKSFDAGTDEFVLFDTMPNAIEVGDTYSVTYGCDKQLATCRDTFDNVDNFRGEPYLPGPDRAFDVVKQRSPEYE